MSAERPTIAELERILAGGDSTKIEILPSGEVRSVPPPREAIALLRIAAHVGVALDGSDQLAQQIIAAIDLRAAAAADEATEAAARVCEPDDSEWDAWDGLDHEAMLRTAAANIRALLRGGAR